MKNRKFFDLMWLWLKNRLPAGEKAELYKKAGAENISPEELDSIRDIFTQLDQIKMPLSGSADHEKFPQFHSLLDSTPELPAAPSVVRKRKFVLPAVAAAMLLTGIALGFILREITGSGPELFRVNQELHEVKTMMMFSMLNRTSPAERLRAVHFLKSSVRSDPRIYRELLDVFKNDPSINVRLATLDALAPHTDIQIVRTELFRELPEQTSPLLQLTLFDMLTRSADKNNLKYVRALLNRQDLNYSVREEIEKKLYHWL